MSERRLRLALGLLAILFYGAHAVYHLTHGFPENLLWACHLGSLAVGVGLTFRLPTLNAVGVLWLAVGTPLWIAGRLGGGDLVITSSLTHLGGLAIGVYGMRRFGVPRHVALQASAGIVVLHLLSRWTSPQDRNVNLARGIWTGFDRVFSSHWSFLIAVFLALVVAFAGLERGLRSLFGEPPGRPVR